MTSFLRISDTSAINLTHVKSIQFAVDGEKKQYVRLTYNSEVRGGFSFFYEGSPQYATLKQYFDELPTFAFPAKPESK